MRRALVLVLSLLAVQAASGADLSGRVFLDANGNGIPDPGEGGVTAAVEVFGALDAGGSFDTTVLSAPDGTLAPVTLGEGCYVVRVTPPAGFRLSRASSDCSGSRHAAPVGIRRYSAGRHLIDALRLGSLLQYDLGDSIAEPASYCVLFGQDTDYLARLHGRLQCAGGAGVGHENHAIGGWESPDLLQPVGSNAAPNLPHPGQPDPRYDNVFDAVLRNPALVTISIGGNDFLGSEPPAGGQNEPFNPADIQAAVDRLILTRQNLQEVLSTLASELPASDVVVNTVYDNRARTCASTDYHDIWGPMWNQVLRDLAWAQGDRFHVAEIQPEYAHQDLNGNCAGACGEQNQICTALNDNIHPSESGSRIHLEKVWEALGGVNLGPRDPLGSASNPDLLFPLEELVAIREPSRVTDLTRGAGNPQAALRKDSAGALLPAGDGEFVVSGFDATASGVIPTHVVAVVRYRTDSAPPATSEADPHHFEASVDGTFAPPLYTVTGWNTVLPIVGAGANAPTINATPSVPQWREVRALMTRNLLDDGRARGAYAFPPLTWTDVASLAVRFRGVTAGAGPDAYRIELDAVWLEVYGMRAPGGIRIYRSAVPASLASATNQIAAVAGPPFDDAVAASPIFFFAVDDGQGGPSAIHLMRPSPSVGRVTW